MSLFGGPNSEPLSAFLILSMTVSRSFSQAASPGVIGGYVMVISLIRRPSPSHEPPSCVSSLTAPALRLVESACTPPAAYAATARNSSASSLGAPGEKRQ